VAARSSVPSDVTPSVNARAWRIMGHTMRVFPSEPKPIAPG
jgi:hypothetical protein